MATLLTTRHWDSTESFNGLGKTFADRLMKSSGNVKSEKSILVSDDLPKENPLKAASKRKALNVASRIVKSKTSRAYNDIFLEPSHVKASALLYEITERTNQLAQPRVRSADEKLLQARTNALQILKASPRIIELSRPRVPYQYPSKPIGYVPRSALTAVATQRIIELSKPKKKRRLKVSNRRKSKSCKEKSWNYVKRVKKMSDHKYGPFLQNDGKMGKKKKEHPVKISNSDKTIIMVGLKLKNSKKNRQHS
ncbi:hypothetical protein WH47_01845 [Habropoda laboriosa]|uniref:Uncharacterized protein n=1 Tax=Habropoda laboriosa TaxID=597456 RepID=A0A0L7QTS3_9HYME|nr:hypothetical protein WH47_01845 [Habropoda laboriosa]